MINRYYRYYRIMFTACHILIYMTGKVKQNNLELVKNSKSDENRSKKLNDLKQSNTQWFISFMSE